MKLRFTLFLLVLGLIAGCKKENFVHQLQGKWAVTDIVYINPTETIHTGSQNMGFYFKDDNYQTLMNDSVTEFGTFTVNQALTQINFFTTNGNSSMKIVEHSDNYQLWVTKYQLTGYYLGFEMIKP